MHVKDTIKTIYISIHAPREGGDFLMIKRSEVFYISIHAPREGGDGTIQLHAYPYFYFNPRPPRGGRLSSVGSLFSSV